jgi:hypothetical protein
MEKLMMEGAEWSVYQAWLKDVRKGKHKPGVSNLIGWMDSHFRAGVIDITTNAMKE